MRAHIAAALVACLAMALPATQASGEVHIGPVVLALDNGQGECGDATGLCPVEASGESLGGSRIDADQDVSYLGVALDRTYVNGAVGFPLLPDGSVMLTPEDYAAPNPAFRILIDVVGERRGPGELHAFGIAFSEEGYGFSYYGPGLNPDDRGIGEHGLWTGYGDPGRSVVSRDELRAYVDLNRTSVDERLDDAAGTSACEPLDAIHCQDVVEAATAAAGQAAPDVVVGFAFDHAIVATDPEALSPAGADAGRSRAEATPPAPRATAPMPTIALAPPARATLTPLGEGGGGAGPAPGGGAPPGEGPGLSSAAVVTAPRAPPDLSPLLAASVAFALAVLLAGLYSRVLRREDALVSARRAAILESLEGGPKAVADLARELALDRTTIEYHARMLQKASRVAVRRVERRVVLCLPGVKDVQQALAPRARDVLARLIAQQGGVVTRRKLEELAAGMPLRTQNRAIQDLQAEGLLERVQGAEPCLRLKAPEPQGSNASA